MPQNKRILLITHEFLPFRGGVATYCAEIAENAAKMGHNVTVMCPHYEGYDTTEDAQHEYKVVRFKSEKSHICRLLRLFWECLKINPKDYDVIHAAEWIPVVVLHAMWPIKKLPFVATVHGTDVFILDELRTITMLRGRDFFRHATRVVTNSRYSANLLKQYHPYIPDEKIRVTLLGVNDYWYQGANDPRATLEKFKVPPDRKMLLTVARLDERKGHRGILKALVLLPATIKDQIYYVIVGKSGSDAYRQELETLAAQTGVPVIFTGPVERDEVRDFYRSAWLYVMLGEENPKKIEGFGLSYLEAAAQSLPSLARPLGGIPEVVLNNKTGIILEDPAPQSVAAIIEHLALNPALVEEYGRGAQEWAKSFTWQRCVDETYNGLGSSVL